ncbi:MAG: anti-CBASS Acb1 family protein, partial [Dehalococcoidales bacterium]
MTKKSKKITIRRSGRSIKASLHTSASPEPVDPLDTLPPVEVKALEKRVATVLKSTKDDADKPGIIMRTLSAVVSRLQLAARAGLQFGGARDLYAVFGWKRTLIAEDFLTKYNRQDIATRVIDAPPAATWSNPPRFKDNKPLQTEWNVLNRRLKLWELLYRVDRLARLNHFSLVMFGFDDTGNLDRAVSPDKVKDILWIRPIGSRMVDSVTFDDDVRSPRFGRPNKYRITFDDPTQKSINLGSVSTEGTREVEVHHSRVIHVVENPLEDTVISVPIMEKIYNLLDDLLKVTGGTAETYWLTGNRGLHANIDKEMELNPADTAALSDEIDEYMHQLRRVVRTRGVDLKALGSESPSPKETFEMIIALISGTTGIPKRILVGAEAGQLASEQDRANWAERIQERRKLFAEPYLMEPLVDKLEEVGLLSKGASTVELEWPSAFIQNPLEEGQTMAQTARAIGNISRQTGNKVPMQLTSVEEGRKIIGLEGDLEESEVVDQPEETPREPFDGGDETPPSGQP